MELGVAEQGLARRGLKRDLDTTRRTIQKLSFKAEDVIQTYSPPTERMTKLPRLTGPMTLREKTVIKPASQFSEHVENFLHEVAEVSDKSIALTRKKCKTLMTLIFPRLRGNKSHLQFREPVFVGSVYDELAILNSNEVEILLPFEAGDITVETLEAGYMSVRLPRLRKGKYDDDDKWEYGRSDDERHLSPVKTTKSIYKIIEKALKHPFEIENVELMPCYSEEKNQPYRILLVVNEKLKVHITPTIAQKESRDLRSNKPFLVTRPYAYDEYPNSDILWRCNYWIRETKIVDTVKQADRGTRQQAFKAFKAFILRDPRLEGMTSYQLKTILLHFLDEDLELSPRWQRDNMESCFRSLMQKLDECLRLKRLSHFFVSGRNLFDNMNEKSLAVIRGRVGYLLNNDKEVVRMLKKRPKKKAKSQSRVRQETKSEAASRIESQIARSPDKLPTITE